MKKLLKRRWIILAACGLILLGLAAMLISMSLTPDKPDSQQVIAYVQGQYPEGVDFAEISAGDEIDGQSHYDDYSHENDPASSAPV
ncbi:MAG: hypothetical protein VB070_00405 [Clostridiaceae bacterium]|nr:hypothetical protein [Clostridiaceae bacterium]